MLLTRKECSALRGIAILGIMLHNYCHWLRVAVKENEFTFSEANNERLLSVLADPDWNLPIHLLSYFGHYGVPLFLFLSGYGLVKKYETPTTPPCLPKGEGFAGWCRLHYLKLFRMMIVGFVLFLVVDNVTPGAHRYQLLDVVAQLLMFNNLLPSPDKVIWPGPFWFFGLMMQLYIVYRLLVCRRHWGFVVGLIALCWLVQLPFLGDVATLNWLRYNCVSGMLPFGLGVLAGRYGGHVALSGVEAAGRAVGAVLLVLGVLLAVAGCLLSAHTWLWVPALVIVAGVGLVKLLPQWLMEWLVWTGGISAAMFVAHPALRKLFIPISHRGDLWTGLLLYVVATVFVSWLVQLVIDKMPKPQS
jgi:peptidoglycan/LPS O-acetylase OafA/YrhL